MNGDDLEAWVKSRMRSTPGATGSFCDAAQELLRRSMALADQEALKY